MSANSVTTSSAVRGLGRVVTLPPPEPGFIGDGHTAVHVIHAREFTHNDPFILLADDRVDLPRGQAAGGPHPHAGFEIVTFVVEGEALDREEGRLRTGDVVWMTAGSGVIHGEHVEPLSKLRILQLWVSLPRASRWVEPRFEHFAREKALVRQEPGIEAIVYSGRSGSVDAPGHTYLPLTMVDVRLKPNALFEQEVPSSYNGFLYPIDGELVVEGLTLETLAVGQVGWLDRGAGDDAATTLRLVAGANGARVVLYAAERQNVPIVTHGPFVGETRADLVRVSRAYAEGRMPRVSELGVPSER